MAGLFSGILVTIREGLEAFLVVGILLGYLTRLGAPRARRYVWLGAAAAAGLSVVLAYGMHRLALTSDEDLQEWYEVVVALLAAAILTWTILWMQRQSRSIRGELERKAQLATSSGALWSIGGLAFVSVMREGLELVLLLGALGSTNQIGLLPGALLGLLVSAALVFFIFKTTVRLPLSAFFRVTSWFLVVIAAGLLSQAVGVLGELRLVPVAPVLWDAGRLIPDDGLVGRLLHALVGYQARPTLLQAAAYAAYLALAGYALWRGERRPAKV